jgi:hypothetical protein
MDDYHNYLLIELLTQQKIVYSLFISRIVQLMLMASRLPTAPFRAG